MDSLKLSLDIIIRLLHAKLEGTVEEIISNNNTINTTISKCTNFYHYIPKQKETSLILFHECGLYLLMMYIIIIIHSR